MIWLVWGYYTLKYFPKIVLDSLTDSMNDFVMKFDLWLVWLYFWILIYDMILNDIANEFLDIVKSSSLIIDFDIKLLPFYEQMKWFETW